MSTLRSSSGQPRSLFLLDSYYACISPLGVDEATSVDGPARDLAQVLAPHHATLAMIHHTNKSVAGGNATNASRGSNALPAAASLTILMNWFRQPAEGQTQNDHRVVVKTQGRAKGTTLLIELKDDGWIYHGDGESVLAAEAMQEAADDLQGRQADVFDYIKERRLLGEFPVRHLSLPVTSTWSGTNPPFRVRWNARNWSSKLPRRRKAFVPRCCSDLRVLPEV